MNTPVLLLIIPGIGAFLISTLITRLTISLYKHFKWLDDPSKNAHPKVVHKKPLPRGGGIPIFVSLLIVGLGFLGYDRHFLGILIGALVLTITGIFDDLYDLNPYLRIFTGLFAALCVVGSGIGIAYITNPIMPGTVLLLDKPQLILTFLGQSHTILPVADIFATIWILWTMNIVNWSKGVDGQMPGFVVVAATILGLLSLQFATDITQWNVTKLAAITAGSYLGFLIWNFYPQKIMPGYGGGSLAGFLLAVISILSGAKVAALILVLGIPMLDAAYTIVRRLYRKKSPVWGDRGHLHHRLLDLGWGKRRIAFFYWTSTAVLGFAVLQLNSTQKLFTIIAVAAVFIGLILWLKQLSQITKKNEQ